MVGEKKTEENFEQMWRTKEFAKMEKEAQVAVIGKSAKTRNRVFGELRYSR